MTKYLAHQYSGKESGLMVYGSKDDLSELAEQIKTGISNPSHLGQVANIEVGNNDSFNISFHLNSGKDLPAPNLPQSTKSFWLIIVLLPFAVLGLVSLFGGSK